MTHTLPITKAREDLTTLVENANKKLEEYIITVNGLPAAVLISAAEYQSWRETNEIMADSGLLHAIREGEGDIKNDKFVTFEQLKKELNLHV
jgi:prevent-host-death family protein